MCLHACLFTGVERTCNGALKQLFTPRFRLVPAAQIRLRMDASCSSSQCSSESAINGFVSAGSAHSYVSSRAPCSAASSSAVAKVVHARSFDDVSRTIHLTRLLPRVLPGVLITVAPVIIELLGPIRCDVCAESWCASIRQQDGSWKGLCLPCALILRESEDSWSGLSHCEHCLFGMRQTTMAAPHLGS